MKIKNERQLDNTRKKLDELEAEYQRLSQEPCEVDAQAPETDVAIHGIAHEAIEGRDRPLRITQGSSRRLKSSASLSGREASYLTLPRRLAFQRSFFQQDTIHGSFRLTQEMSLLVNSSAQQQQCSRQSPCRRMTRVMRIGLPRDVVVGAYACSRRRIRLTIFPQQGACLEAVVVALHALADLGPLGLRKRSADLGVPRRQDRVLESCVARVAGAFNADVDQRRQRSFGGPDATT